MAVDLDAIQARDTATMLRNIAASAFHVPASHLTEALNALELAATALDEREALVAELRAAREVIKAAHLMEANGDWTSDELHEALANHKKLTGESSQ